MRHKNYNGKQGSLIIKDCLLVTLLANLFFLSSINAQESINTSGKNVSGNTGSVNYSVGLVAYQTKTGNSGLVNEGVQQPYIISEITGIEEINNLNLSVAAYPNPSTEYLILEVKDLEISELSFQIYDIKGNLLQSEKITDIQTEIIMNDLVPANYFVKIIQNNKEVKTFRIIKNL